MSEVEFAVHYKGKEILNGSCYESLPVSLLILSHGLFISGLCMMLFHFEKPSLILRDCNQVWQSYLMRQWV